jgi:hypothetical protein
MSRPDRRDPQCTHACRPAPDMQKPLQVDRLIGNSTKRVFYLMKPQGDTLQYIVDQQFETGRCQFQRRDTRTPKP